MCHLFRSEEMVLCQLLIQSEAAHYITSEFGELGIVQFVDLNEAVSLQNRKFIDQVRTCESMEQNIRYIRKEIRKEDIRIPEVTEDPQNFSHREIYDLEKLIRKSARELQRIIDNTTKLRSHYIEVVEMKQVLEQTRTIFRSHDALNRESLTRRFVPHMLQLDSVAGIIDRERLRPFETMVWRVCGRNVVIRNVKISEGSEEENDMQKTVFVIFYRGEAMKIKIEKICSGFHAKTYPCTMSRKERDSQLEDLNMSERDLEIIINETNNQRRMFLTTVAQDVEKWSILVTKMKAIFHTLNLFVTDVVDKYLIGECWVPAADINVVRKALADGTKKARMTMPSHLQIIPSERQPPTYIKTNKFTRGFQNLIDAYGIPNYQEANPALYSVVTFPFLFAVMFGDIGHGAILTIFALYLIGCERKYKSRKIRNEVFHLFYAGRYITLMMGLFSMYIGFIYNDFFSKSIDIYGSSWFIDIDKEKVVDFESLKLDPREHYVGTPYALGMDPVWSLAENNIIFFNSFKMKAAIIIGVIHMIFGVSLNIINLIHFKKRALIILELLPQIIFLSLLFLWLAVMIFIKWILYSADKEKDAKRGTSCAPSVLIFFINMMLFKESEPVPGCDDYMFTFQPELQKFFVFVAIGCVPVLMFGKPLYMKCCYQKQPKNIILPKISSQNVAPILIEVEELEQPQQEVFITQAIHTIEYVLGTVSHTASYLRLWALSLAHSQLSEILWKQVLADSLNVKGYGGVVSTVISFSIWAVFTFVILVTMEGLSAFLHTLRLHWFVLFLFITLQRIFWYILGSICIYTIPFLPEN